MKIMKLSVCPLSIMTIMITTMMLMMAITFAEARRSGEKIHFQDSSELNADQRPGAHGRRNRNHRGHGRFSHRHEDDLPQFEQGIPGVYPIRGPPQAAYVLPASHPDRVLGLQSHNPQQMEPTTAANSSPIQPSQHNSNGGGKISWHIYADSVTPTTNKYNSNVSPGVTNRLSSSDKPSSTTLNPRRLNLMYGSNLLEQDNNRDGKTEEPTDFSFNDRGLFDTAPHCQPGHILVNNKCRLAV